MRTGEREDRKVEGRLHRAEGRSFHSGAGAGKRACEGLRRDGLILFCFRRITLAPLRTDRRGMNGAWGMGEALEVRVREGGALTRAEALRVVGGGPMACIMRAGPTMFADGPTWVCAKVGGQGGPTDGSHWPA